MSLDSNLSINKYLENNKINNQISTQNINIYISDNILNKNELNKIDEIEIPIKKKKGRKSKKMKLLELEELERKKEPIILFPTLNEKIFDIIEINEKEYFFDSDFNIIYDDTVTQVGIKKNNKYILYSEFNKINEQIEIDNNNLIQIMNNINLFI
jgi:hypothetical protein